MQQAQMLQMQTMQRAPHPGLARVGAIGSYGWFSPPSKIVMSVLMVMGRLEIYVILVLLTPRFWRGE